MTSEPQEFLYRCPVCKVKKVESMYVERLYCQSDEHNAAMQYLGEQPVGIGTKGK